MSNRKILVPLVLLLLLLIGSMVLAQVTPAINRWVVGGGGGTATGGNVSLSSTLGQALAGPSSGGDVAISVGFWSGGPTAHNIYLPMVARNLISYAPPCGPGNNYCEDYDSWQNPYGPLESDVSYSAYPNDANDYYYFVLRNTGAVTVRVTNYQAEGQVLVRDEALEEKGKAVEQAGGDGIMEVSISSLPSGKYYIQLYTAPGHENSSDLYTLRVTY